MGEILKYYLLLFLICGGLVLPGMVKAEDVIDDNEEINAWQSSGFQDATVKEERAIIQGCAFKAELVFYAAQQKLYASGNVNKLLAYLQHEMSEAEYRLNEDFMRWVGTWVDEHDYRTAHEYSSHLFAECVSNSYQHLQLKPTDKAAGMMKRFYEQLDNAEEHLLPMDGTGETSA